MDTLELAVECCCGCSAVAGDLKECLEGGGTGDLLGRIGECWTGCLLGSMTGSSSSSKSYLVVGLGSEMTSLFGRSLSAAGGGASRLSDAAFRILTVLVSGEDAAVVRFLLALR